MTEQETIALIVTLSTKTAPFIVKKAQEFVRTSKYCSLSNTQRQAFYQKYFDENIKGVEDIYKWISEQAKREVAKKWAGVEDELTKRLKKIANILDSEDFDYFENLEHFGLKSGSVSFIKNYLITNEDREIARKQFAFDQQKQFVAAINQLCLALDAFGKSKAKLENPKDKLGELFS